MQVVKQTEDSLFTTANYKQEMTKVVGGIGHSDYKTALERLFAGGGWKKEKVTKNL